MVRKLRAFANFSHSVPVICSFVTVFSLSVDVIASDTLHGAQGDGARRGLPVSTAFENATFSHAAEIDSAHKGYMLGPIPEWVKPTPAFDPELKAHSEPNHGFRNRLREMQYNGIEQNNSRYFSATEYVLTNQYAVENYSNIEISFDPAYESLTLHELVIKRGERLIDKLPSARYDLLRTEAERDELIYNGTLTLAVVPIDVRSGDTVRYSYSVQGENPIYAGYRELRIYTQLWNGVDRNYSRVLTASDRPFVTRFRGPEVAIAVKENAGVQELVIDQRKVDEFEVEDDVPAWRYTRGMVVYSDMQAWHDVAAWAAPMYEFPDKSIAGVINIADSIRQEHSGANAQVGAALQWVQEEIRYFGVELGTSSHQPSPPLETLSKRFGDCKAKALLLMAILKELGIDSHAALVNTKRGLESNSYPFRMHAFNHVIVHVEVDGESHFIDPTKRNQSGELGELHEPNYGRALLVSNDTIALTKMSDSRSKKSFSSHKHITLATREAGAELENFLTSAESVVSLQVETLKQGQEAEHFRGRLQSVGIRDMSEDYLEYYEDYFEGLSLAQDPSLKDGPGNSYQVTEFYNIPEFWQQDEDFERYRWLFADEIIGYLDKPEKTNGRLQPYQLIHPIDILESWTVNMPKGLRLDDLDSTFSNQWMSFTKQSTLSEDGTQLNVEFHYQTLVDEVAAEDLKTFSNSVEKITDLASFYIEDRAVPATSTKQSLTESGKDITYGGRFSALMLLVACLAGSLRFLFYLIARVERNKAQV